VTLLITGADVDGRRADVRIADGRIVDLAPALSPTVADEVLAADGGALLPGLHDHHVHLHAMAAAAASLPCGPPAVSDPTTFASALRAADAAAGEGEWISGVGYHESVAGELDRHAIDRVVASRPVRIQHRGGALWMVNSCAVRELGQLDADARATGRLWRADAAFHHLASGSFPDLAEVGRRLGRVGITGVTDATPDVARAALEDLEAARASGRLPQQVTVLGTRDETAMRQLTPGPRKLLLADHELPTFDDVVELVARTHAMSRAVAVHCVTREALLLTLAALDTAGHLPGDRIEHAAVVPAEARQTMAAHRIAVVTQPSFVADRGDAYLADVDPCDRDLLYPYASLLAAGVPVAPSSDAPFGDLDPWRAMAAASERRTTNGAVVAGQERVTAARVLAGYLSAADDPGGPPRRIVVGGPAELCLLRVPLTEALRAPTRDNVVLTVCGTQVYSASSCSTT
jgi:predicted amidohydrolase YtcJ